MIEQELGKMIPISEETAKKLEVTDIPVLREMEIVQIKGTPFRIQKFTGKILTLKILSRSDAEKENENKE